MKELKMDAAIVIENWKDIPGYEGIYQVSDLGRVKRIKGCEGTRPGKIVNPWIAGTGYCVVGLSNKSKVKTCTVHRLVYKAFVKDPEGLDVCHNNGIRTDNALINLRADTRKGNMSDIYKHDTHIRGERCGTNKYTEAFVAEFKQNLKNFKSIRQAAFYYNLPYPTAHSIAKGKTWGWL